MKKLIYTVGLPGCGKSTWAKSLIRANPGAYKEVNKDSLREMLDANHYSRGNEKFVLEIRDTIILAALKAGKHVIVSDTNFEPRHAKRFKELASEVKNTVVQQHSMIDVPIDVCIERDLKRPNSVGPKVIRRMYNKYLKPPTVTKIPDFAKDYFKEDAIIIDLDGTYALFNDRSPYDAAKCESDTVNEVVRLIANAIRTYKDNQRIPAIILVSGRMDTSQSQTENWLSKNSVYYTELFMRKEGDFRKDVTIKTEIYEEHIRDKYNVLFVLDDRNQTVKGWRDLGLQCLQVADGDF